MTAERSRTLRVGLAQINTTVGDFDGNLAKVTEAIRKARDCRAQVLTFPELALTGYPPEDLLFKRSFVSKNLEALRALLSHTHGLCVVLGFVDRKKGGELYNAAALLADGRLRHVYHKTALPNYGVFDEKRYFLPGKSPGVFTLGDMRMGLSICEDLWDKKSWVYQKKVCGQMALFINISASPYHRLKHYQRLSLVRNLAGFHRTAVIYQNLVGGQDELVFDGGSMVIDSRSRLVTRAESFKEDLVFADLTLPKKWTGVFKDPGRTPLRPRPQPRELSREEEVYRALVLGTRDYLHKNNFKKALIGISGGIDSALVACIAVDALGARNVTGVTMPSRYTSGGTYADSKTLCKKLGVALLEFPIERVHRAYLLLLKRAFKNCGPGIAEENLQARIRGNILMALSNQFGHLVLTTGNKSELATGYCTLYGDMAGGFAVLKDVPKTLVYKLAGYRNSLASGPVIPQSIIRRAPTAELRLNQKDRDSLPPYPLLDRCLELYVEKDLPFERIVRGGVPPKIALEIVRKVDLNEYKRRQAPPGVKITPLAFGKDRRIPITHRFYPSSQKTPGSPEGLHFK
ncbi:MAG: NAD+ synthase [Candidatus Omnitrophica bacterium]|nr:NAD+ synthase [Candidatus Omnitrophota bacterium]